MNITANEAAKITNEIQEAAKAISITDMIFTEIDRDITREAKRGGNSIRKEYIVFNQGYHTYQLPQDWKKSIVNPLRDRGFEVETMNFKNNDPQKVIIDISW